VQVLRQERQEGGGPTGRQQRSSLTQGPADRGSVLAAAVLWVLDMCLQRRVARQRPAPDTGPDPDFITESTNPVEYEFTKRTFKGRTNQRGAYAPEED
jgi:hypothetical protein